MARRLFELDIMARGLLRSGHTPDSAAQYMAFKVAENAVELGFVQHANGSWVFHGDILYGDGVTCIEQVPLAPEEEKA